MSEPSAAPAPEELLLWLSITDIEEVPAEDLRAYLAAVLEGAPDEEGPWETLLMEICDVLDSDHLDLETVVSWPQRYGRLAPDLAEAEELVVEFKVMAGRLVGEQCAGTRLQVFLELLLGLTEPPGSPARARAEQNLKVLEEDLCDGWNGYTATPLEDLSARSLATHRVLAEAYEAWGLAIDLAREGDNEGALQEALRGSRLFTALIGATQPEAA
jgi:hypothetical protein